jgi:hypothetical protein
LLGIGELSVVLRVLDVGVCSVSTTADERSLIVMGTGCSMSATDGNSRLFVSLVAIVGTVLAEKVSGYTSRIGDSAVLAWAASLETGVSVAIALAGTSTAAPKIVDLTRSQFHKVLDIS